MNYGIKVWLGILATLVLVSLSHAQNLPDMPMPQLNRDGTGWVGQRQERAVNKKFVLAHSIYLAAVIYDSEMTRRGLHAGKCSEKNFGSTGPQVYAKNLAFWGGITLADYGMRKIHVPLMPYLLPGYPTFVHIRDGSEWATWGCL